MQTKDALTPAELRVQAKWLTASGVTVIVAMPASVVIVLCLRDAVTAAAWVLLGGVILNGAGMAIRAGVHGAPRGSCPALMDGVGKLLSLIGWSSALIFVGFNTFRETDLSNQLPVAWVIITAALVIGAAMFGWACCLRKRAQRVDKDKQ